MNMTMITTMIMCMTKSTSMSRYRCTRTTKTCLQNLTTMKPTMSRKCRQTFLPQTRYSSPLPSWSRPRPLSPPLPPQKVSPKSQESQAGSEDREGVTEHLLLRQLCPTTKTTGLNTVTTMITVMVTAILIKEKEKCQEGMPPPRYRARSCPVIQDWLMTMRSV